MTAVDWKKNEWLEIEGHDYRVTGRAANGMVNLKHVHDGYDRSETDKNLVTLWQDRRLIRRSSEHNVIDARDFFGRKPDPGIADFDLLPVNMQGITKRKWAYIKAILEASPRFHNLACIQPIIDLVAKDTNDSNPPKFSTVVKWVREYIRTGYGNQTNLRVVVPQTHRCGNRTPRFPADVREAMEDLVNRNFLKPNPDYLTELHVDLQGVVKRMVPEADVDPKFLNLEGKYRCPSLTALREYVGTIPKDEVIFRQEGRYHERYKCDPVIGGPKGDRPMGDVEVDHFLQDIILMDIERRIVLGRPWLTLVTCRKTRAIAGFHIGFHSPSAHTVGLALKTTILPKDKLLAKYSIRGRYDVFGIPGSATVDNAAEFDSVDFNSACFALGIDVIRCEFRTPHQKGKVERCGGRINRQFAKRLPGYTGSNIKERGDRNPTEEAALNLHDFIGFFLNWVVREYMVSLHRSLPTSPEAAWNEGVKTHPVRLPDDVNTLDALLTRVVNRKLTRKGIEVFGLRYSSKDPAFKAFINRADKPQGGVRVKINDDDLNYVLVEDWRFGSWIKVPSVDPEYTEGLTLDRHMLITARARGLRNAHVRLTIDNLIDARTEMDRDVEKLKRLGRMNKKLAAKLGDEERMAGNEGFNLDNAATVDFTESKRVRPKKPKAPAMPHAYKSDQPTDAVVQAAPDLGVSQI